MEKKLLGCMESIKLKRRLSAIWDIKKPYWYPLFNCNRDDVIAFDSNYIESDDKLELIKNLIKAHGVNVVYELRENGVLNKITDISDYEFWRSDDYFWNNECFWFDINMDWIIYISHERTTTFGGAWLMEELKKALPDWENHIWGVKRNKVIVLDI